jgi:hypothetical protein
LMVLAGHFHYTQTNGVYDNIPYNVVGATGGSTKKGNVNAGDVRLYGVLTYTQKGNKRTLDLNLYSLDTNNDTLLSIPPADAMDRVQAQNVISGSMPYGYVTIPSALYYNSSSGIVGTSCSASTPATIQVIAANGIDQNQVMNFDLVSNPSGIFKFGSSNFVPGQWVSVVNSTAAVIAGAKNSDLSNFSVSNIVSYYTPIVNMWNGTITTTQQLNSTTPMTFRFSTSFNRGGETYYLYNDIIRNVAVC